jgi:hypothetical protein
MDDGSDASAAHLRAIHDVLDTPPGQQHDALAHNVVEFGLSLVSSLRRVAADPVAAGFRAADQELLTELAGQAPQLLRDWLSGERITARADEGERRVLVLKRLAAEDPLDSVLGRLAADAILRLPAGHELRDLAFARHVLLGQADRARESGGDVNDLLMSVFYLLHHDLIAPEEFAPLIDDAIAVVGDRTPDCVVVGDLLEAAHNYCIVRAGEELVADGDPAVWMGRAERLLAVACDQRFGLRLGSRLIAMRARQLDIADNAEQAAEAYAEFIAASDPKAGKVLWAVLSEATLRLQTGEYQRVLDRLTPLTQDLLDRYLTAVTDTDIAEAGLAHGRAIALMASALTHLDRLEAAICLIDTAKSARLRYRVALRQHPAQAEILELERAIVAASRGTAAGTGHDVPTDEPSLLLRTRLLEQYRRLRPSLGDRVGRIRPVAEIASVLEPGEGVVVLAAFDDMTTVSLVTPAATLITVTLRAWPWSRWDSLLDGPGGWRQFLARQPGAHQPETTGQAALDRLTQTVDRALGESILELIKRAGEGTRKIAIVPHRWLHLIPYWALPSLAALPVLVFSSVDELVTSRSSPPQAAAGQDCLVIANPTGDLLCSDSETESVAHMGVSGPLVVLPGGQATASAIATSLQSAAFFHFSGHAYSDHGDPDRSALLVAPSLERALDPFPGWVSAAAEWRSVGDGWQITDIPGTGRLSERRNPQTQHVERRMERGSSPTLYARYVDGRLRRLGELWSVGDILALGQRSPCRFAFLSACESGVAGGKSSYIDEYGGLPAALRLGGVNSLICSLWEVDEGFTALYADLFYTLVAADRIDPVDLVRQVGRWLREARKPEILQRLDRLTDQARERSPRAAMALEAYRAKIDKERGNVPYSGAWEWASFYAIGGGVIDLEGPTHREVAEHA